MDTLKLTKELEENQLSLNNIATITKGMSDLEIKDTFVSLLNKIISNKKILGYSYSFEQSKLQCIVAAYNYTNQQHA